MLPYANVHKLVKLWILKDMMQEQTTIDSLSNSSLEHIRQLPHEIQFEIIKYIPSNNPQDEWWMTCMKHRLISSFHKQHFEREMMTRWNREGMNLSRFLFPSNGATFEIVSRAFQVVSNLLRWNQAYNATGGSANLSLPPIVTEEGRSEAMAYWQRAARSAPKTTPKSTGNESVATADESFLKSMEEYCSHSVVSDKFMVDEIINELDGKAQKDFTFEIDQNDNSHIQPVEFYMARQSQNISRAHSYRKHAIAGFEDNYFVKKLVIPILQPMRNIFALVDSLKELEYLHIIYYGSDIQYLMSQFDHCHANTIKLTITSPCPFADVIHSFGSDNNDSDYDDDETEEPIPKFSKHFPNLRTLHVEGIEPSSFSVDDINKSIPLPNMHFHMANQHVGSYVSSLDVTLQVHVSEFHIVPDWNKHIQCGVYINPFNSTGFYHRGSLVEEVMKSTTQNLTEKKQFIQDVLSHPGKGPMLMCESQTRTLEEPLLEQKCLIQWSVYCLNKYRTYKLLDGFDQTLRDYLIAQNLLYGWDPSHNLLETLVALSTHKLAEPIMAIMERKLRLDPGAFSLKSVQRVISILFQKNICWLAIKLIELVKKYMVDGCDLFKPPTTTEHNGTETIPLLHYIFCMDLPMVVMENVLQFVSADDLIHVVDVEQDKTTVFTLALSSPHLSNEFLLQLIEKQHLLAHLPVYNEQTITTNDNEDVSLIGKRSLLHYVVSDMRRWELIPTLVDTYGCDLNVKDLSGRTPRDVAILLLNHWNMPIGCLPPCLQ